MSNIIIIVIIKKGKILTKIFFLIKKGKPKDEVSYSKRLAKMKYQSLKATETWKFPGLADSAFYCDQISSCNNPINPN